MQSAMRLAALSSSAKCRAVGVRSGPQVDHGIVDATPDAPHELALARRRPLEMHAAHRALSRRAGEARLHQARRQAVRPEFSLAVQSCERTALVIDGLWIDASKYR